MMYAKIMLSVLVGLCSCFIHVRCGRRCIEKEPVTCQSPNGVCEASVSVGHDLSLICMTWEAQRWCDEFSDFGKGRMLAVDWFRDGKLLSFSANHSCTVETCQGFVKEISGQSLVLANATRDMAGNYSCHVTMRNFTDDCCSLENEQIYGRNTATECPVVKNFQGSFSVTVIGDGSGKAATFHRGLYPWHIFTMYFGSRPRKPNNVGLIPGIGLLSAAHGSHLTPHLKHIFNYSWRDNSDGTIEVLHVLNKPNDVTIVCDLDAAYPVTAPAWTFRKGRKKKLFPPIFQVNRRRWSLHLDTSGNARKFLQNSQIMCSLGSCKKNVMTFKFEVKDYVGFGLRHPFEPREFSGHYKVGDKIELCVRLNFKDIYNAGSAVLTLTKEICEQDCPSELRRFFFDVWDKPKSRPEIWCYKVSKLAHVDDAGVYKWTFWWIKAPDQRIAIPVEVHVKDLFSEIIKSQHKLSAGYPEVWAIVGSLGGLVFILLLLSISHHYKRRNKRKRQCIVNLSVKNEQYQGGTTDVLVPHVVFDNAPATDQPVSEVNYLIPAQGAWEIERDQLQIGTLIGEGAFGKVYEGNTAGRKVAIKMLRDNGNEHDLGSLLDEMLIMEVLSKTPHPNVLNLIGSCTQGTPVYIVSELATNGSLQDFLRGIEGKCLNNATLLNFALDIAQGMKHIAIKKIVHRDLAARNILVTENLSLKVADFGLTRCMEDSKNYYVIHREVQLPVKWMAPESLQFGLFTVKTDVWSYGVVLWEIYTLGETPYVGIDPSAMRDVLMTGYRMMRPPRMDSDVYNLMKQTWCRQADARPSFTDIVEELTKTEFNHGHAAVTSGPPFYLNMAP